MPDIVWVGKFHFDFSYNFLWICYAEYVEKSFLYWCLCKNGDKIYVCMYVYKGLVVMILFATCEVYTVNVFSRGWISLKLDVCETMRIPAREMKKKKMNEIRRNISVFNKKFLSITSHKLLERKTWNLLDLTFNVFATQNEDANIVNTVPSDFTGVLRHCKVVCVTI